MKKTANKPSRRQRVERTPAFCPFCQKGKGPDYKDYKDLAEFVTGRGRILSRSKTGSCARHQRALAQAVKRARFLALLSFTARV